MACERSAELGPAPIREIQDLEEKLGVTLVAYERPLPFKRLSDDAVARLKETENEIGALLLAYEA